MRKLLIIIPFCFLSLHGLCQVLQWRSYQAKFVMDGTKSDDVDWTESNVLIELNMGKKKCTFYGEKHQVYKIIQRVEDDKPSDMYTSFIYQCSDAKGNECSLLIQLFKPASGLSGGILYLDYVGSKFIYAIKSI